MPKYHILKSTPLATRLITFASLALVVVALIGVLDPDDSRTSRYAVIATILATAAATAPVRRGLPDRRLLVALGSGAVAVSLAGYGLATLGGAAHLLTFVVCLALGIGVVTGLRVPRFHFGRAIRGFVAVGLVLVVMLVAADAIELRDFPIDVLDLHRSAASELANGSNPYVSARAVNTSPLAPEGTVFEGYVYPPSTMMPYVISDWLFGDPRWATVIAVTAFVLLILRPWSRMGDEQGAASIALATLFVSTPSLSLMINTGWTDALALPLLLGAGLTWRSKWIASSLLLGLAFSTKQYFVLALPIVLVWPFTFKWKRIALMGAVAVATFLPFVALDAPSILSSVGGNGLNAPYRSDSLGFAGLGINVPRLVSYSCAGVAGLILGGRGGRHARFFMTLAAVLAIGFVTGFQAFVNYWLLVVGVLIIALTLSVEHDEQSTERPESSEATEPGRRDGQLAGPQPDSEFQLPPA